MIVCSCGKETSNVKFCSRVCSNRRKQRAKRTNLLKRKCKTCGCLIPKRRNYCDPCRTIRTSKMDCTLREAMYTRHHKSSAYALVRTRARGLFPPCPCQKCGYEKHTEVCHINPIGSFPLDTKLSVINDLSNLLRLCPNCHWEHDNL